MSFTKTINEKYVACAAKRVSEEVRAKYRFIVFTTTAEIPHGTWTAVAKETNGYFDLEFLRIMEENNKSNMEFRYAMIFEKDEPVAIMAFQFLNFDLLGASSNIKDDPSFITKLGIKAAGLLGDKAQMRMMVCGNCFLSGENGFYIKQNKRSRDVILAISDAIEQMRKFPDLSKKASLILIKDFITNEIDLVNDFKNDNFHEFAVDPNMIFHIDENWKTFDDYTSALKSKFRTKANRAFALSKEIGIMEFDVAKIEEHLSKMTALYKQVEDYASFNLSILNLNTYRDLKKQFEDDFIVKGLFLNDELVGFMTGFVNNQQLDAHFIGLDYKLNRDFGIYQRILYEYIQVGIERSLKRINFGRTANEIKSTVGALPEELTLYIKLKNPIGNKIARPIFQAIKPNSYKQHSPFKGNDKK
ncbi:MAG: GNAT family N-acetyltransferase [Flavobacteriales bacterium]|nr:GNAT family N-acetyltransferase [Flavobacteriales bacterium]